MNNKILCYLSFLLCAVHPALAASADNVPSGQLPEEIVVTGQRTLKSMRVEIEKAEDRVFELFNELNDDDFYDISCSLETRPNTRIKFRTCTPEFYKDAQQEEAESFLTGRPYVPVNAVAGYHYPVLAEKMQTVMAEHPDFAESLVDYMNTRQEYLEFREDYFAE